jgi:hypothetical protein
MGEVYVAINDPVHQLLRCATRKVPLCPRIGPDGQAVLEYRPRPADLSNAYYALAVYHGLQGIPLANLHLARCKVAPRARRWVPERANYFDALSLDRRCCRDLRLKLRRRGPGLLAADLLTHGAGCLRARNDNPADALHTALWRDHGRIFSRYERVHATIRALPWDCLPLLRGSGKESFDSTNLIYGDVLGELEQMWERRADTMFLDQVARELQGLRRQATLAASLCPPLNAGAVYKLHLRAQARWKTPPASGRVVLRRLEHILNHLAIDNDSRTEFKGVPAVAHAPEWRPGEPWREDATGYDGWLA